MTRKSFAVRLRNAILRNYRLGFLSVDSRPVHKLSDKCQEWAVWCRLSLTHGQFLIPKSEPTNKHYLCTVLFISFGRRVWTAWTNTHASSSEYYHFVSSLKKIRRSGQCRSLIVRPRSLYAAEIWKRRLFLLLRLDLVPSTPICHENRAFRKRSSNERNMKTLALRVSVDGKIWKRSLDDNHVIFPCPSYAQTQIQNDWWSQISSA